MMTALAHSWFMTERHLRNLLRQPAWVALTLVQPLIYLLLYGAAFRRIVEIPGFGGSYVDYLTPGIVVMTALFSAGWAGMGMLDDLDRGVLDRFLGSPVSRAALTAGRGVQLGAVIAVQSAVIVAIGYAIGAHYPGGVPGVFVLAACAVLLGVAFASLSIGLALVVRREETVIAAVNLVLLPLTFLSSVFMRQELMPGWIQTFATYNPVNWAVQAGRDAMGAGPDWSLVLIRGGCLLGFALTSGWLATLAFRSYRRSL